MNPFAILELDPASTREQVVASYRRLARKVHPDHNPDLADADRKFSTLTQAYKQALEAVERREKSSKGASSRRARGYMRIERKITIMQAVRGCTLPLEEAAGQCGTCHGEGAVRTGQVHACRTCAGTGVSGYRERGIIRVSISCTDCSGSGRSTRITCPDCGGSGSSGTMSGHVIVPPGSVDGEIRTAEGTVVDPHTGERRNIEVVLRVQDAEGFRLVGDDIESSLEVEVWEAALGCIRDIQSPDGRKLRLTIPAGSRHGRKFRFRGPLVSHGGRRDFVIRLAIRIPDASKGNAKAAFERLALELETARQGKG